MTSVAMNLLGVVEHPGISGGSPYRVDAAGRPYVPVGDGGIVLGVRLGDSAYGFEADHAAPGACLVHPDPAARHALTAYACVGNEVIVRTGAAAGARGWVTGKRGEAGRVIVLLGQDDLARLRPGDQVSVRASGQGARLPGAGVELLNLDPELLPYLPVTVDADGVEVTVRGVIPSRLAGNGLGRPAHMWDLDVQTGPDTPGLAGLRLGDLVSLDDVDVRYNMGYRRGRRTVGLVVHGDSPQPGHGPGVMPFITGPAGRVRVTASPRDGLGLTEGALRRMRGARPR
ncbi:DUF4438 domain-containing protein [Spongiactinospora gelatinilytica]|uniref:DUF4438 domain-containing protein n=1 Tax=Spongiactinospora gelatinilytica TaxID=2666298 RepID=A0A2W2G7Z6_9ACTN|nr:DUF4438 domain-containing protein [Spongiactinospora gelatinilytica]PZG30387.1 DUF4438 domain-containing protein [Spongiactinospora gelatinilytica]